MHILERSVESAGARTAFAGLLVLAMFGATLVSFFVTGATISAARSPRLHARAVSPHAGHYYSPAWHPHVHGPRPIPAGDRATIVDVAPGVTDQDVLKLVRLAPGEHVVSVDDCPAYRLTACALLAQPRARPAFRDLEVAGGRGGPRRVVLLLH